MVLHEEYDDDLTNEEIKRIVADYLSYRLNIDFDNLAEEIINSCEKHDEINDDDKNSINNDWIILIIYFISKKME